MLLEDQGQFVLRFRQEGDPDDYECILGYGGGTGPTEASAQVVYDGWALDPLQNQGSSIIFAGVRMEFMTSTGTEVAEVFGGDTGGISEEILTQNVAFLVHKRTNASGRGSQGRMYVPGVPQDSATNIGVMSSTRLATFNTSLSDFWDYLDSNLTESVVVNHGVGSPLGPTSNIQAFSCDPVVASQRRRLRH